MPDDKKAVSDAVRNAAKRRTSKFYNTPEAKQTQWTIAKARNIFPERVRNHVLELRGK